jgi:hypothetical protein
MSGKVVRHTLIHRQDNNPVVDDMASPVAEYLSMVGEAHILAERLSDLKTEYLVLVDQHEFGLHSLRYSPLMKIRCPC